MRNYIRKKVTTRSLLELMAEESTELAEASLELSKGCMKMIRARQCTDNPTPLTYDEAIDIVNDSFRMIFLLADILKSKRSETTLRKSYRSSPH